MRNFKIQTGLTTHGREVWKGEVRVRETRVSFIAHQGNIGVVNPRRLLFARGDNGLSTASE